MWTRSTLGRGERRGCQLTREPQQPLQGPRCHFPLPHLSGRGAPSPLPAMVGGWVVGTGRSQGTSIQHTTVQTGRQPSQGDRKPSLDPRGLLGHPPLPPTLGADCQETWDLCSDAIVSTPSAASMPWQREFKAERTCSYIQAAYPPSGAALNPIFTSR